MTEETDLASLAARENGNESKTDQEKNQSISDEIRKAFDILFSSEKEPYNEYLDFYSFKLGYKTAPKTFAPDIDVTNKEYTSDEIIRDLQEQIGYLKGDKINCKGWLDKAQAEIEELTESIGTYYDLNNKLEQQLNDLREQFKKIESERKLFAEQYEKYLHLCSDQSNHIKKLEQKIADMEYKEKYL